MAVAPASWSAGSPLPLFGGPAGEMFGHSMMSFRRDDEKAPGGWAQSKTWRCAGGPMAVAPASWSAASPLPLFGGPAGEMFGHSMMLFRCDDEKAPEGWAQSKTWRCAGGPMAVAPASWSAGSPLPLFGGPAGEMFGHSMMSFRRDDEKAPEGWAQSKTWRCAGGPMAVAAASWSAASPLPLFGGPAGEMFGHSMMLFRRDDEKAPEGWAQSKTWRCAGGPMAVAAASWSAASPLPLFGGPAGEMFGHSMMLFRA